MLTAVSELNSTSPYLRMECERSVRGELELDVQKGNTKHDGAGSDLGSSLRRGSGCKNRLFTGFLEFAV